MALLNTAYQLVRWGHNVLMVDADLEAPGLTLLLKQYLQPTQPGFIGFFETCTRDFMRRFNQDSQIEPLETEALRAFWENIPTENREKNKTGHLALMPTGRLEQYLNHLNRLDIASLYRQGIGYAIAKECQAWLKQMPFDQLPFDYVLIDSRTGYNEASGLCVNALAEALVVVTALNVQNLDGTKQFLTDLGLLPDRPIDLIFAISPVPPWQDDLTKARLREFQEKFQCSPDVLIP
ncbi:MAG: KGGVGR-motif variant AAA ATPase, partial [bacterium]